MGAAMTDRPKTREEAVKLLEENHWQWCHDCAGGDISVALDLIGYDDLLIELEQARTDVLKCRDALTSHMPRFDIEHKVLADTEHYEQYR